MMNSVSWPGVLLNIDMIQVMRRLPPRIPMDEYEELMERLKDIALVRQVGGLLSWDQEVLMPPKAAALRAEQLCLLYTSPSPRD